MNRTTGVTRIAQYGRNTKGQALSRAQRREQVRYAFRKAEGLAVG